LRANTVAGQISHFSLDALLVTDVAISQFIKTVFLLSQPMQGRHKLLLAAAVLVLTVHLTDAATTGTDNTAAAAGSIGHPSSPLMTVATLNKAPKRGKHPKHPALGRRANTHELTITTSMNAGPLSRFRPGKKAKMQQLQQQVDLQKLEQLLTKQEQEQQDPGALANTPEHEPDHDNAHQGKMNSLVKKSAASSSKNAAAKQFATSSSSSSSSKSKKSGTSPSSPSTAQQALDADEEQQDPPAAEIDSDSDSAATDAAVVKAAEESSSSSSSSKDTDRSRSSSAKKVGKHSFKQTTLYNHTAAREAPKSDRSSIQGTFKQQQQQQQQQQATDADAAVDPDAADFDAAEEDHVNADNFSGSTAEASEHTTPLTDKAAAVADGDTVAEGTEGAADSAGTSQDPSSEAAAAADIVVDTDAGGGEPEAPVAEQQEQPDDSSSSSSSGGGGDRKQTGSSNSKKTALKTGLAHGSSTPKASSSSNTRKRVQQQSVSKMDQAGTAVQPDGPGADSRIAAGPQVPPTLISRSKTISLANPAPQTEHYLEAVLDATVSEGDSEIGSQISDQAQTEPEAESEVDTTTGTHTNSTASVARVAIAAAGRPQKQHAMAAAAGAGSTAAAAGTSRSGGGSSKRTGGSSRLDQGHKAARQESEDSLMVLLDSNADNLSDSDSSSSSIEDPLESEQQLAVAAVDQSNTGAVVGSDRLPNADSDEADPVSLLTKRPSTKSTAAASSSKTSLPVLKASQMNAQEQTVVQGDIDGAAGQLRSALAHASKIRDIVLKLAMKPNLLQYVQQKQV
jgi:hypothetical protein